MEEVFEHLDVGTPVPRPVRSKKCRASAVKSDPGQKRGVKGCKVGRCCK